MDITNFDRANDLIGILVWPVFAAFLVYILRPQLQASIKAVFDAIGEGIKKRGGTIDTPFGKVMIPAEQYETRASDVRETAEISAGPATGEAGDSTVTEQIPSDARLRNSERIDVIWTALLRSVLILTDLRSGSFGSMSISYSQQGLIDAVRELSPNPAFWKHELDDEYPQAGSGDLVAALASLPWANSSEISDESINRLSTVQSAVTTSISLMATNSGVTFDVDGAALSPFDWIPAAHRGAT